VTNSRWPRDGHEGALGIVMEDGNCRCRACGKMGNAGIDPGKFAD
jgi:hypothetical protein